MHSPSTQIRRPSSSQEVPSTTWMLSCSTFYIPLIHYASKTLHGLTFFIDILKPFWHGDNRTSLLWAYSWARTFLGLSSRESNRSTFAQTALGWTSHTAPPCIQGYCADWSDILLKIHSQVPPEILGASWTRLGVAGCKSLGGSCARHKIRCVGSMINHLLYIT